VATTSFVVLDGENTFAKGTPTDFMQAVKPLRLLASVEGGVSGTKLPVFAAVNGDVHCNMCGFKNDVAGHEFVGESAVQCASPPTRDASTQSCSLEGVHVTGPKKQLGPLPSWAIHAGKLYDADTRTLTGLLDSHVVTATIRVGCSSSIDTNWMPRSCVRASKLQKAVKKSLGSDCAHINIQLRRAEGTHQPVFGLLKDDSPLPLDGKVSSTLEGPGLTEEFDAVLTAHTSECTALVTQWVKGFQVAQFAEDLHTALPQGIRLDETTVQYGATYTTKGMNPAQALEKVLSAVVSTMQAGFMPAILVSRADAAAVGDRIALPTFTQGSSAVMALTGFVPGKPVTFQVAAKCMAVGGMVSKLLPDTEAANVGQFTPSNNGVIQIPFAVPAGLPPGVYSMRAEQNGLGFCSQPFEVT
jgi:hypothetical protein